MQALLLASLLAVLTGAGAGMTRLGDENWLVIAMAAGAVWALWMLWRNAIGDYRVSWHWIYFALAVPIVAEATHLMWHPSIGGTQHMLLADGDGALLVRMSLLSLLVLLVQDLLGRVSDLRPLLAPAALLIALGCCIGLPSSPDSMKVSCAGTGLAACLIAVGCVFLPRPVRPARDRWEGRILLVAAAILAAVLILAMPRRLALAAWVGLPAVCFAALAGGILLPRRLPRYLCLFVAVGAGLGVAAVVPDLNLYSTWGGLLPSRADTTARSGLEWLAANAGWAGLSLTGGALAGTLCVTLWGCRKASSGDAARVAIWTVAAAAAACAMLSPGGLSQPSTMAVVALAWGLLPHMALRRAGKLQSWPTLLALIPAMLVLGLSSHLLENIVQPVGVSDTVLHALTGFIISCLVLWQLRCRRWWVALAACLVTWGLAAAGEPMQKHFSRRHFDWNDIYADGVGCAIAWAVFVSLTVAWALERRGGRRRKAAEAYLRQFTPDMARAPLSRERASAGRRAETVLAAAGHSRTAATPAPSPTAAKPGRT